MINQNQTVRPGKRNLKMKKDIKEQLQFIKTKLRKKSAFILLILLFIDLPVFAQLPVANFTASITEGCAPLQVVFTNNSTNAESYKWTFGDGNTSTIYNPSNIFVVQGNYEVKLVIENNSGVSDSFMLAITVHPKPTASFSSNVTSGCINNNQITFNNTSGSANSFLWDFGDGNTSTITNPSHAYSLPGNYSIKLIATNNHGCTDIVEKINHITIYPNPDADFSANITYACSTSQAFMFTPIQTGLNYLWDFGDGNTSTIQSPSHNYSTHGKYTVSLSVSDNNGCGDTVVKYNYVEIREYIPANIVADQSIGCPPLLVNFSVTNPTFVTRYDFGNGNQGAPSFTYNTPGSYDVTVIQIDNKNCAHYTTFNNFITVHTPPQISFTTNDTIGCIPYDVQFTNNTTNAIGYNWNFGDFTPINTDTNPQHTYYDDGSFDVTLEAISSDGCVSLYTQPSLIIVSTPVSGFSSNVQNGCAPLTVNFTNQAINAVQYNWNFGDGTSDTAANPVKVYTQSGNYTVSLAIMSANGCADTIIYNNYIRVLNPYAGYIPPSVKSGCAPFTVSFTDNTSGNSNVTWDFGDGTTSNATHPTHTYTTPGIYTVSLSVQTINGCSFNISNYQTIEVTDAKADFSINYTSCPPYIASFTDSSVNAVSWLWNFGDGNISVQQNPTHIYGGYGTYNVSLTITTADGCTQTKMVVNAVVFEPLAANFSWVAMNSGFPMVVDFTANSTGAMSWLWDFGDGGTSTLENPTHTYQQAGQYSVTLTITNDNCSITYLMSSTTFGGGAGGMDPGPGPGPPPETATGCAPFTAQFNDPTTNSTNWLWNFGDGNTSTLQNPVHTYFNPGIYDITLIITKSSGAIDTIVMNDIITVSGPIAAFNVVSGTDCQATVASVTDQSVNAVQWNWDFGDGNISTQQHPSHTYQSMLNNYSIGLTATDSSGCTDQMFQNINTGSSQPISANKYSLCKGGSVQFQSSLSGYSFYIWDFGDGSISFTQQPLHVYSNHGNYQVSLTVYSGSGCTFTHYLPVNISVNGPIAEFTVNDPTSGCDLLDIQFENLSNNYTGSHWIFSDGSTSSLNNPNHTFSPGVYDVTLIVESNGCKDSITKTNYITVGKPIADFSFVQNDICLPSTVSLTNLSTNIVAWEWDFGDATYSQAHNPVHTYASPSTGYISLTVFDTLGCSHILFKSGVKFLAGSFTAVNTNGCAPLTVNFSSNLQNVASVLWLFGDGDTSTLLNPMHTYLNAGSYDVKLILKSAGGCTDTITEKALIGVNSPTAAFSHTISSNCIPSVVNFTNNSLNAGSWYWDFGDGTYSSAENPSKVYNTPGHYDVMLIATNIEGCKDTIVIPSAISVSGPVTDFSINTNSICLPVITTFTDLSLNTVSWIWNFGDGNSDSIQNPIHIYSDTGLFSVTLIATDTAGCTSVYSLPASVEVRPVAEASFITADTAGCTPFTSLFVNNSLHADAYQWTFGDGNNSTSIQPSHIYQQAGIFDVQLIADNQYGCADTLKINQLIDVVQSPVADFTADILNGCSPLLVQFTELSSGLQNPAWTWNFSNGDTSTLQNPEQWFLIPGGYTISLTITNEGRCSSSVIKPSLIIVNDLNPPAESPIFSVSVKSDTEVEITYGYVMDLDLSSYNLYRKNLFNGNFDLIYTQYNINSTSFSWDTTIVDNNLSTTNNVYVYKIQTVDICGNTISLNDLQEYHTINVTATLQSGGTKVSWNQYGGCDVASYNIYRGKANQIPQLIATVSPDELEYSDTEILCPDNYYYKIEATGLCNLNFNSWSDTSQVLLPNLLSDQKVEVIRSTVIDNESVLTEWTLPVLAPEKVLNYNLYRSENNSNYQLIGTFPAQVTGYIDFNTDVDLSRYIYSVEVVNICNLTGAPSNIGNSILLDAKSDNGRMILNWNGYVGWKEGVDKYKVERMDESGFWKEIGNVDEESRQFID
jgi:PKD repeat protein